MKRSLFRVGGLLALAGIVSCGVDTMPVAPTMSAPSAPSASQGISFDAETEVATLSASLAALNDELAASGSDMRVAKEEYLMEGNGWDGASSTIVIADNRFRGIGAEWVASDPRRGGRIGVNYAVLQNLQPTTRNADGSNVRLVPYPQLDTQIEEGMTAWRNQSCSAPITRVPLTQPVDIFQLGWYPRSFFLALAGPAGDNIIGVTRSFIWINSATGAPTDIDGNGKLDLARSQIYYNNRFFWGTTAARNVIDFYSIITHETGHSLGLGHFGKVFVTKQASADGIQIADIKYAPLAIMNAVYVTGRGEIAGTDHSSFCQIWASVK